MIHCMSLKSPCSDFSSVGRMTGTLEISRPNIRAMRQTADRAIRFLPEGERGIKGLSKRGSADSVETHFMMEMI
ncbi:hypothetical protein D9M69_566610 [compost metagenome]